MDNKFCINCKHIFKTDNITFSKCLASQRFDLVTGDMVSCYCWVMRSSGDCGAEGKLYEQGNGGTDGNLEM